MPLYVVRHAKAGQREGWDGPDLLRPLTSPGRAQALALASWLSAEPVPRLLSSPYTRCVQTLEPLADKLGLPIESSDLLVEGVPFEPVLDLLGSLPDHSVLCSHGDVIQDVVEALLRRGCVLDGQPDWRKGATWILTREDGVVSRLWARPPGDAEQL